MCREPSGVLTLYWRGEDVLLSELITTTHFELVDIDKLVPYVNNARTHSPEQINKLRASLREFGFVNPDIIDRDYNILVGHGRTEAARLEGYKQVPCVFADELTEAQKKAYILADNRMALDAGWDEDLLRVEFEALGDLDFDLSLTGFDDQEIADLFGGQILMPKTMTLTWMLLLKKPALLSVVICGTSEDIDSCVAMLLTRQMSQGSWMAKRQTLF